MLTDTDTESENVCVICKDDLGSSNPRQLCGKWRCLNTKNSIYEDDIDDSDAKEDNDEADVKKDDVEPLVEIPTTNSNVSKLFGRWKHLTVNTTFDPINTNFDEKD